jgi:hypothetical protein
MDGLSDAFREAARFGLISIASMGLSEWVAAGASSMQERAFQSRKHAL